MNGRQQDNFEVIFQSYYMMDLDLLLANGAAYKTIKASEVIFQEGQSCAFYHQLVSGLVKWVNVANNGRECIHSIVEPGESFGEFPLFDDETYTASAVAEEDSVVIRLNKSSFLELLQNDRALELSFIKLLSKRVRFAFERLNAHGAHQTQNRISTVLNYLIANGKNIDPVTGQLLLTRKQIADMTGLRIETVIRTMRNMHENGQLTISKGKVYCKNMIELIPA